MLRAAWGGDRLSVWWSVLPMLWVLGRLANPLWMRLSVGACVLGVLLLAWRRRVAFPAAAPLRRAVIERAALGEVIVRLDDGALWGFQVSPDVLPRLHEGELLTLPEPTEGRVVAAVDNRLTGRQEAFPGTKCRLYRPPPSTYVAPVASLDGGADELSQEQARAFLEHRIARLSRKVAPRRRTILADIGSEPALEAVSVAEYAPRRAEIARADGGRFGWPTARDAVLLRRGDRVWATRVEEGLYVVLVATTDEGRRAELIWPQGRAVAQEQTGDGVRSDSDPRGAP